MTAILGAPIPPVPPELIPICRPDPMSSTDKMRLRAAAATAKKTYPGPVGTFLERELLDWEAFGFRLGSHSLVWQLVDELLSSSR